MFSFISFFIMCEPSLQAADVYSADVTLKPLNSSLTEIKTLLQLIKTSIGPYGKLKIVQNISGGHVTITSTSSRLFHITSVKNIFLKYVISSALTHLSVFDNGGLYCALLTLYILENSIKSSLPTYLLSELIQHFGKLFVFYLKMPENNCIHSVELSQIVELQNIIYCIVNSKPACVLTEDDKSNLSLLLLKAFLRSIPELGGDMCLYRNITYCTEDGNSPKETKLLNGVLVKIPKIYGNRNIYYSWHRNLHRELLVALFSVSLAGDADLPSNKIIESGISLWDEVLVELKALAGKLICDGIQLVLCQKVVHPSVRKQLEDNGVLVLDRLGIEIAHDVEQVTGAVPVLSLSDLSNITYGLLTSVEVVEIGKRKFFSLQNENRPFWTIFICNYNEEAVIETKVVCKQVISTLYRLLKNPKVCCGGGCMETHTGYLVRREVMQHLSELSNEYNCSTSKVIEALEVFLRSLYNVALSVNHGTQLNFVTESAFNHLWKLRNDSFPSSSDTCQCGKYVASTVHPQQWHFLHRTSVIRTDEEPNLNVEILPKQPHLLDELNLKVHATTISFEAAASLLQVGLCVSSRT